jgi:hypothetical protein
MPASRRRRNRSGHTRAGSRARAAETRLRTFEALALMRTGKSLTDAARRRRTTGRSMQRYVGSALRKEGARYRPTPFDQMKRPMVVLTPRGKITLDVRGLRSASLLGKHYNAIDEYLKTGNAAALRRFRGKTIRVGNARIPLVSDPDVLERLARAGEVRFEEIYDAGESR